MLSLLTEHYTYTTHYILCIMLRLTSSTRSGLVVQCIGFRLLFNINTKPLLIEVDTILSLLLWILMEADGLNGISKIHQTSQPLAALFLKCWS